MGNKIVFLSRVVDFEILRDFFYGSTELISKEGKFVERFFFLIFCCIWRVLRIYIGEGKGEIWHVNSIRYRAFIIVGTMNVFLESDADRWQNVQAFSSRILDILERNDPDNEDSYWWEKCDWKLILYSPGKKISFLKNCLDSWNSWLRYISMFK